MSPCHLITADAHALPLAHGCCAAACCIAALSLFADPVAALRELRRVVQPGGPVVVVSGTQAWAEVTRWPPALAAQLHAARMQAQAAGTPQPHAPDVGDELAAQFAAAGFAAPEVRAFLLGMSDQIRVNTYVFDSLTPFPSPSGRAVARSDGVRESASNHPNLISDPAQAELALLPWRALRREIAHYLDDRALRAADKAAATSEIELCTLALAARAVV